MCPVAVVKNDKIKTAASIISSIQPVYGILIGMLVLKEFPEKTTIIGGLIILSSVVIESARTYRK